MVRPLERPFYERYNSSYLARDGIQNGGFIQSINEIKWFSHWVCLFFRLVGFLPLHLFHSPHVILFIKDTQPTLLHAVCLLHLYFVCIFVCVVLMNLHISARSCKVC